MIFFTICAFFYFRHVKHVEPDNLCDVIHAKHKKRVPVVLTKEEVRRVIDNLEGNKQLAAEFL
ncbi:hypothetical protein [Treponema ruminis]|uniref:hypothetical protein n=1 Tax=Treponema ruminis TaxID=744515 RepID=UPI00161769A5|nr:hypothetical protein [Treponema ruminis]